MIFRRTLYQHHQTKTMTLHFKKRLLSTAITALLLTGTLQTGAQKISGVPGSPTSTYTINGKSIPIPPLPFGGVIKTDANARTG